MSFYPYALLLHILGVLGLFILWSIELTCMLCLRRARTVAQCRDWGRLCRVLLNLFPVMVLLILTGGITMVTLAWGWTHAWIDLALGLLVLMAILGPTLQGRRLSALYAEAVAAPDGPVTSALQHKIQDRVSWASVLAMGGTMLGIVALMTLKPDWIEAIAIIVVAALLGLMVGLALARPGPSLAKSQFSYEQTISRS
jgi:hypothetical protein